MPHYKLTYFDLRGRYLIFYSYIKQQSELCGVLIDRFDRYTIISGIHLLPFQWRASAHDFCHCGRAF